MYTVIGVFKQNKNITNEEIIGVFDNIEDANKFAQIQLDAWDSVRVDEEIEV